MPFLNHQNLFANCELQTINSNLGNDYWKTSIISSFVVVENFPTPATVNEMNCGKLLLRYVMSCDVHQALCEFVD